MSENDATPMALYRLYLETAEKVSDRRAAANAWMLSVNSAIVALYGYLSQSGANADQAAASIWRWAIPAAGVLVCFAWASLLESYRQLNGAKYKVLQEIEQAFPHRLFHDERAHYKKEGRTALSAIESRVPWSFAALYALVAIVSLTT